MEASGDGITEELCVEVRGRDTTDCVVEEGMAAGKGKLISNIDAGKAMRQLYSAMLR